MFECGTTNREPAKTAHKTGGRLDPRRVYTVLLVVPLLYGAIRYLPPFAFTCIVAIAGCLALYELYRLCVQMSSARLMAGIGLVGCIALMMSPSALVQMGLLVTVVAVLSIPVLMQVPLRESVRDAAIVLTGMLYIGLTLSYLVRIRLLPEGELLLFFLLLQ